MRGTLYIYGAVLIALCAAMAILGANGKEEKRRGSDWCSDEDVLFHDLEEGKLLASSEGKPLMAIITAEWCSPCRTLKYALKEFQPFERLAKKFVMVLLEGDEEPRAEEYRPDGAYFPRIFFAGADGRPRHDLYNKNGNATYRYFYFTKDHLVQGMEAALESLSGPSALIDL